MINSDGLEQKYIPVVDNMIFGHSCKIQTDNRFKKIIFTAAFMVVVSGAFWVLSLLRTETVAASTINFNNLDNISYRIIGEDGSIGRMDSSFYEVDYDTIAAGGFVVKFPVSNKEDQIQWMQDLIDKDKMLMDSELKKDIEKLNNLFGNKKRAEYVRKYSEEYGVPIYLVAGMIYAESSNRPEAISKVGARGLMQLMPETAIVMAKMLGMYKVATKIKDDHSYLNRNEKINIHYGVKYLRHLYDKIGSWKGAVHAYNQGYTRYRKGYRSYDYVGKVFGYSERFSK